MLVLDPDVIEELELVQLDNVEDFLGLFELFACLEVLQSVVAAHC